MTDFFKRQQGKMTVDIYNELSKKGLGAFGADYDDHMIIELLEKIVRQYHKDRNTGLIDTEKVIRDKVLPRIDGYSYEDFLSEIKPCIYRNDAAKAHNLKGQYWQIKLSGGRVKQVAEVMAFHFLGKEKEKGDIIRRNDGCFRGCINPYHIWIGSRWELSAEMLEKHVNG